MMRTLKTIALFFLFAFHHSYEAAPLHNYILEEPSVRELAAQFDIAPEANLVESTQQKWLRKPGQERWEMDEIDLEKRCFVMDWAKKQGLFSEWRPTQRQYDKALVLGATTSCMQGRLNYLKKLWNEGIRFNEIIWLTGERPLDDRIDRLLEHCQNESDAARYIHLHTDLPTEMRALPVCFIAVPMKGTSPQLQRPNTQDTIVSWIQQAPTPCIALFISDQPFCGYQFAIVKNSLPDAFSFDIAGEGIANPSHPSAAAIILDTVARWIYQENLNTKGL